MTANHDQDHPALQIFNVSGSRIRFGITDDDTPYAVASDFAKAMGYRQTKNAVDILDDEEKGFALVETPGGRQRLAVIYEDGLWELIFRSSLPGAKAIKKQVKAILRKIRETGRYDAAESLTSGPATVTWEHAAAVARHHHQLNVTTATFRELLNKGGILTNNGRPHKKWEHLFWPVPSGTRWEVHASVVPQLVHFAATVRRELALAEKNLQMSLPFPISGLVRDQVEDGAA